MADGSRSFNFSLPQRSRRHFKEAAISQRDGRLSGVIRRRIDEKAIVVNEKSIKLFCVGGDQRLHLPCYLPNIFRQAGVSRFQRIYLIFNKCHAELRVFLKIKPSNNRVPFFDGTPESIKRQDEIDILRRGSYFGNQHRVSHTANHICVPLSFDTRRHHVHQKRIRTEAVSQIDKVAGKILHRHRHGRLFLKLATSQGHDYRKVGCYSGCPRSDASEQRRSSSPGRPIWDALLPEPPAVAQCVQKIHFVLLADKSAHSATSSESQEAATCSQSTI